MQVKVYTPARVPRIFEVTRAESGPNGELMLMRGPIVYRIFAHGQWEEIECYDANEVSDPSPEDMLKEFHSVFPAMDDDKLRLRLLREEVKELAEAMEKDDIVEVADGIADIVYVAIGTAVVKGIPFDDIFSEVHRSNMTKREPDGSVRIREDGKILKGKNFERPKLRPILKREGLVK